MSIAEKSQIFIHIYKIKQKKNTWVRCVLFNIYILLKGTKFFVSFLFYLRVFIHSIHFMINCFIKST